MKNISDKQRHAAHLLVAGKRCNEVAEAMQVTPETISAWRKLPVFEAYCNELRNEAHFAARDVLMHQSVLAAQSLGELIRASSSEETRRKAAVDVLTFMGHGNLVDYFNQIKLVDEELLKNL